MASASDVWAVGSGQLGTLTEHWDGASWSIVSSPNVTPPPRKRLDDTLGGVAARTALDVWAVGDYAFAGGQRLHPHRTLVEHWNGVNWSIVPSPNLGTESNHLDAVTQIGADTWAVGTAGSSALIEHICEFGS